MARSGPLLTEAQWKKIAPLLPRPPRQRKVAARGSTTVVSSNGFCGFCAAAGRVVEHLGRVPERVERAPAVAVERVVSGRQFCTGEKRGCGVGKTKRGKGTKWLVVVDGQGLPLGDHLHSASPAGVRLAETTAPAIRVGRRHHAGRPRQKPVRVIADK